MTEDYRVELDTFRGPLDLLLYLVKRDEIDILDIPIARVAEQFKQYLEVLKLIDVEGAGDFLVMASTLMEIKSKMLLPPSGATAAAGAQGQAPEDPRRELVRQLLQYKRFKEASQALEEYAQRQGRRLARLPVAEPAASAAPALQAVELWDLVSAFGRLLRETLAHEPQTIAEDHTPLHVHIEEVLARLREARRVPFSALFTPPRTRSRLVGTFLAILELAKSQQVAADQPAPFGEIWVELAPQGGVLPVSGVG
jgi:segregation and condensation protein A